MSSRCWASTKASSSRCRSATSASMVGVWGSGTSVREMNPLTASKSASACWAVSARPVSSSSSRWSSDRRSAFTTVRNESANAWTTLDARCGSTSNTRSWIEFESTSESTWTFLARASGSSSPSAAAAASSTSPRLTRRASCSTFTWVPASRLPTITCSAWYWVTSREAASDCVAKPATRPSTVVSTSNGHRRLRTAWSLFTSPTPPERRRPPPSYRGSGYRDRRSIPPAPRDVPQRRSAAPPGPGPPAGPAPAGGRGCRSWR